MATFVGFVVVFLVTLALVRRESRRAFLAGYEKGRLLAIAEDAAPALDGPYRSPPREWVAPPPRSRPPTPRPVKPPRPAPPDNPPPPPPCSDCAALAALRTLPSDGVVLRMKTVGLDEAARAFEELKVRELEIKAEVTRLGIALRDLTPRKDL